MAINFTVSLHVTPGPVAGQNFKINLAGIFAPVTVGDVLIMWITDEP